MGLGARPPTAEETPGRPLPPEASARLEEALAQMDELDPDFKSTRTDERNMQLVKIWTAACKGIDRDLRALAKVLIQAHQLSLDIGSQGGGREMKPWLEETSNRFPRLMIRLDDGFVVAVSGDQPLGRTSIEGADYDWLEQMSIAWILGSVASKRAQRLG